MIEILEAGHHAHHVEGDFEERGGIMQVGPPGNLKTTSLLLGFRGFSDAIVMSDLTLQQFIKMREDFVAGRYNTMAFLDLEKLYRRNASTASNLEGLVMALAAEGFRHSSAEDHRAIAFPVHAHIVGAMTTKFQMQNYTRWADNGFLRRFIWTAYHLKKTSLIGDSIDRWEKLKFGNNGSGKLIRAIPSGKIKYVLEPQDSKRIREWMREQPGRDGIAFAVLKRIACALLWKHSREKEKAWAILEDFAPSLRSDGAELVL